LEFKPQVISFGPHSSDIPTDDDNINIFEHAANIRYQVGAKTKTNRGIATNKAIEMILVVLHRIDQY
jgi:hypothetical protein